MRRGWFLGMGLVLCSCGSSQQQPPPEYPPMEEPATHTEVSADPAPTTPEHEATAAPEPVRVVPGENTPLEGAPPTLRILSPRAGTKIRSGHVMLRAELRNWELSPEGNHVHLIIDNEPYIAVRDLSHPLDLNALTQENLGHELAPGTHLVRMFPSRAHHESVKPGTPFAWTTFIYQTPTAGFSFDPNAPLLTYSRPKGCNVLGQAVMLDFYLTNVPALAANGMRVHYTIDDSTSGDITEWVPHNIENLGAGTHHVRLQLIGADGNPVAGPFNDTTREITVQESCPAPPHGAMNAPAQPPTTQPAPQPQAAPAGSEPHSEAPAQHPAAPHAH